VSPVSTPDERFCSECGRPRSASELARFGDRLICPDCKDTYAQKLREGVAPAMTVAYAGFWIRFVAALIDGIILYVVNAILQFAMLGSVTARVSPGDLASTLPRLGLVWLISVVVGCSYETFFIGKMAATPGKMALGLKVVRADGSAVDYPRAAGRYFSKILSAIILLIGYMMAGWDSQKRALHDMICDTRVIKSRG
jgi:uncharacterized RDD family membrane protein YckC